VCGGGGGGGLRRDGAQGIQNTKHDRHLPQLCCRGEGGYVLYCDGSLKLLELRISPRIFEKIRNDPNVIIRGLGEGDS
jgi:hypothetical protein